MTLAGAKPHKNFLKPLLGTVPETVGSCWKWWIVWFQKARHSTKNARFHIPLAKPTAYARRSVISHPIFSVGSGVKIPDMDETKKTLHTSTSEARNKDSRCSQYMPDPHTTHRVAPELENLQPDHKVGHHNLRGFDGCKLAGYLNCWFVRGCLVGTTKWGPEHPKTVTACYTSMGTSYSKLI